MTSRSPLGLERHSGASVPRLASSFTDRSGRLAEGAWRLASCRSWKSVDIQVGDLLVLALTRLIGTLGKSLPLSGLHICGLKGSAVQLVVQSCCPESHTSKSGDSWCYCNPHPSPRLYPGSQEGEGALALGRYSEMDWITFAVYFFKRKINIASLLAIRMKTSL